MATKVLVFESDSAFANELVSEFQSLGCELQVVDDGNIGLQMAAGAKPDLILLSIELPRMNGFSVCNKLKKDPNLKDIPLIIMSSESSEETFEQHKRLRTRAEEYVHKPITFADLLERVRSHVPIATPNGRDPLDGAIIIDDDIAFEENEEDDLNTDMMDRRTVDSISTTAKAREKKKSEPPSVKTLPPRPASKVPSTKNVAVDDLDVDAFADDAFDRLLEGSQPPPPPPPEALSAAMPEFAPIDAPLNFEPSTSSQSRPATISDVPDLYEEEVNRLRAEVSHYQGEVVKLEQELTSARGETRKFESEAKAGAAAASEVERLQRQVEELKARAVSSSGSSRAGGISSREFLDLRETLNKKDKEILALRDQMSQKDKDLLDARDFSLSLERQNADKEDKLIEFEHAVFDLKMEMERLTADKQTAAEKAATLQAQLEGQVNALEVRLADAQKSHAEQLEQANYAHAAAHEAQKRRLEGERDTWVKAAEDERDALKAELESKVSSLELDKHELQTKVGDLEEQISTRDRKVESLEGAKSELESAKKRLESKVRELEGSVSSLESDKGGLEVKVGELESLVSERDGEIAERDGEIAERDGKIAELESKVVDLESEVTDRNGKVSELERVVSSLGSDKRGLESQVAGLEGSISSLESDKRDLEAKIGDLEGQVKDRDDVIGELEGHLNERDGRIRGLESELGDLRQNLEKTEGEKNVRDRRIRDLESSLAKMITDRDSLTDEKQELTEKATELATQLGSTKEKLTKTEASLNVQVEQARKTRVKWDQDRASLDKAKNALAAVLLQIEEVESRVVE